MHSQTISAIETTVGHRCNGPSRHRPRPTVRTGLTTGQTIARTIGLTIVPTIAQTAALAIAPATGL